MKLKLRIGVLCNRLSAQIAPHEGVEGVEGPTHDLDVLLRHRPRSISPKSAAFHAKQ
jgi:hypothetical protein